MSYPARRFFREVDERKPAWRGVSLRLGPVAATTLRTVVDIVLVLAVFSALLVSVALSRPVAARLSLTPVVLLAAIGVTISATLGERCCGCRSPIGSVDLERLFADLPLPSEIFIYVFLPLLVFQAAVASDVRRILEDAAPILVLAVIATLVAAGIVGVALWPFAGLSLAVCLLLGAVVSTTDTGAVIAIFRDVGAPARLKRLVGGERRFLGNDATAIALYTVLLGVIVSGRHLYFRAGRCRVRRLLRRGRRFGTRCRPRFPLPPFLGSATTGSPRRRRAGRRSPISPSSRRIVCFKSRASWPCLRRA